jgi:sulfotransferase
LREFKSVRFVKNVGKLCFMHKHSMPQDFHFIAGMPFSGITQLTALLQQNPIFCVAKASPLVPLFSAALDEVGLGADNSATVTESQRLRLLRGLFTNYYADKPGRSVIFDTNRSWVSYTSELGYVFPQAKFVACVRNMAWVLDSVERVCAMNPQLRSRLFGSQSESASVASRAVALAKDDGFVGTAWSAIKQAFQGKQSSNLLVVDYEMLMKEPQTVLELIYNFIEQPMYMAHDLSVLSVIDEFGDEMFELPTSDSVLPKELFDRYSQYNFWLDDGDSSASVLSLHESTVPRKAFMTLNSIACSTPLGAY